MDTEKVKLIVRNLELLVDSLKAEIYTDVKSYEHRNIQMENFDYDEIFEENYD
jgi:hypothetical protein